MTFARQILGKLGEALAVDRHHGVNILALHAAGYGWEASHCSRRARVQWRDVWVGAAVTALLFSIGKHLIGLYIGKSSVASGFGAAGSLVVVLVWVYYSAQIFLLGAEFTWVYAHSYGSLQGSERPTGASLRSER